MEAISRDNISNRMDWIEQRAARDKAIGEGVEMILSHLTVALKHACASYNKHYGKGQHEVVWNIPYSNTSIITKRSLKASDTTSPTVTLTRVDTGIEVSYAPTGASITATVILQDSALMFTIGNDVLNVEGLSERILMPLLFA